MKREGETGRGWYGMASYGECQYSRPLKSNTLMNKQTNNLFWFNNNKSEGRIETSKSASQVKTGKCINGRRT